MIRHRLHRASGAAWLLVAALGAACGAAPPPSTAAVAPPALQPADPAEPARPVEAAAPVPRIDTRALLVHSREEEARGELGLAYTLQVEVLEVRRASLGSSDPSLLPVLGDLARLAYARDDLVAARQWLRESRELVSDLGGEAYVAQLRELLALARLHSAAGGLARAAELCSEVLPGLERELGEDAALVVDVHLELAHLLLDLDRAEEAEPHLQAALAVAEAHGGRRHVDTLHPRRALALLASDAEDWPVAHEQWRAVVATEVELFGKQYVGLADCRYELARSLVGLGMYAQAQSVYETVLASYRANGGGGAPEYRAIAVQREVGRMCREQQNLVQAKEVLEAALVDARKTLGARHAQTLLCMDELVLVLTDAGRLAEARDLAVKALLATPVDTPERTSRKDRARALGTQLQRAADGAEREPVTEEGPPEQR